MESNTNTNNKWSMIEYPCLTSASPDN